MKKVIRLTESDLHSIIKESVNRIIMNEWNGSDELARDEYRAGNDPDYEDNEEEKNESKTTGENLIRLTENDLRKIVKETAEKVLKEANWSNSYDDDIMGPNARLEDLYPDEYPKETENDIVDRLYDYEREKRFLRK